MRGKTKYFIIVLLLGLAISSLVGFSSWNIHVQEVFDSPFEYYENASSFIEDYITINGKRIDGETEIKAPLNKTTDNKGESTANDEQETRVTATGYPYSVTINDKDLNEQDSVEQVKWSEWKKNGLTFTYNYYQTSEYTASKDDATGKTVWSYGVLSKNVVIGSGAPKNAGGYVCVITAGVTEGATDSAKRAAENLNISTKTVNGQTFENYAAIIEFRIIQQETSATEPQYTYQEKAADENQNGTQSLSLRTNAPYKALRTANNGLFESTAQNPATTQSGKMTTTTQELTYGGKNYELSITANFASDTPILNGDDVTIKFDFPDGFKADDEEHNAIARIVNVKDGKENPNYNLVNPFATYKIKKRFVKISEWQNLIGLTYNGQEQKPTPTLEGYSAENQTGVPASDDVNVKALQFDTKNNVYTDIDAWTNAGSYTVKALLYGADSKNYEIVYKDDENPVKDFIIEKASIALPQADGSTFTYNGKEQIYVPTIDGTSASEVTGYLGEKVVTVTDDKRTNAGTQIVTITLNDKINYKWADTEDDSEEASVDKTFEFIINKRAISVTIINQESTYGNEIVDLSPVENTTYTVAKNATVTDDHSAIVSGDNASDIFTLSVKDSDGNVLTAASNVGTYAIEGTQKTEDTAKNYDVTFINATYTINKRTITVTIEDKSSVYGDALKDLTATTDDAVANKDGLDNIFTLSTTAESKSNVGTYAIKGTQKTEGVALNYDVTFNAGTYTLTVRKITVLIEDKSSTYGDEIKTLTATTDDTVADADGLYNIISLSVEDLSGNVLTSSSDAGTYPIEGTKKTEGTAANYVVEFTGTYGEAKKQGTYTVEHATIEVSYDLYSGTYDGTEHGVLSELTVTTVNNQTATILYKTNDQTEFTETLPTIKDVGSLSFTVIITADNHDSWQKNFTVTVKKKTLTIKANDQTINKGKTPSATANDATYSGFVNGENYDVLTGTLTFEFVSSTDANKVYTAEQFKNLTDDELQAANYSFKIKIEGYSAKNYDVTYADGTLTVEQEKTVAIPVIDAVTFVYDGTEQHFASCITNYEEIKPNLTIEGGAQTNAGDYTVTFTLKDGYTWKDNPTDKDGYLGTNTPYVISWTIAKRSIEITIDDKSSTYGSDIAELTYRITSELGIASTDDASEIFTIATTATKTSLVKGSPYPIEGTEKTEGVALNYDVEFVGTYGEDKQQGTYTIEKAGFKSITVIPYSQEYDGKNHSLFTLTVVTATGDEITVENDETLKKSGLTVDILLSGSWQTIGKNDIVWPNSTAVYTLDVFVKVSDDNHVVSDSTEIKTAKIKKVTYSIPSTTATFTYNGTAQGEAFINALTNYDANNKYTLTFKDANGKTIDKTKIVDAGNYKAIFTLTDKTNYQWADNTNTDKTIEWSIAKLKIKFDGVIEINYNENGFSYNEDLLKGYLIVSGTSQSFNEYFNGVTPSKVFESADATDGNGHDRSLTTTYNGKVGSTYNITATATDNYEFVTDGNIIYLKYKTVYVNGNTSTYYTIEEAVALSGSTAIVLAANKTGVVETWFTSTGYYSGTEYYTLSAKDLIVPYIDDSGSVVTASTTNNSTAGTTGVHAALCIPEGVTLTVSKTLNIVAYVACASPDISRVYQHGVVMNYGTIKVESGGKILAYGYLKGSGNGLVKLESGSSATDLFRAYDYLGGAATYTLTYTHWFPINSYTFHNISCKTDIYPGATYQTSYRIYVPTAESWTDELFLKLVSNSNDALFTLKSGYVTKYAVNAAKVNSTDSTALTTIGGSNQIKGQKDVIELHGVANDNTISVTVKISIASQSIATGVNTPLPLPYLDIVVCKDASLTLTANSYKFMPGTSMTIEEDATLTTANTSQLVFYTEAQCSKEEQLTSCGYSFYNSHCVDKSNTTLGTYDAKLIVNGTANIPGRVSGKILTNSDSAKTSLTIGTASTQILVVESFTSVSTSDLIAGILGGKPDYTERQTALMSATGNLVNGNKNNGTIPYAENANLSSNTKYNSVLANSENKTYAWYSVSGKYSITYNPNGGVMPSSYTKEVTYGQQIGSLPTPTKAGYKFVYWVDDNGNEVTSTDVFYVNLNLTAKWEALTYDLTFNLDGVQGTVPATKTVTYDNPYGDLSSPTGYNDGYAFLGWYTEAIGGTQITSTDTVKITANTTLYARWQVTITLNSTAGSFEGANTQTMTLTRKQTIVNNINVSPTLSGYELAGWTTDGTLESYTFDDASSVTTLSKSDTATTPLTLYAVWEKASVQVNVTFDLNYPGATAGATQQLSSGKTITYEPAEREGYHFLGWFDSASGGNEVTIVPDSDTTLYAHWQVFKYTINFNSGIEGVTLSPTSIEVKYGSSYSQLAVSEFTYTYEPKSLIGWTYNGKEIDLTDGLVPYLGSDGSTLTFTAIWEDNYHVVINSDVSGAIEGILDFYVSYKEASCTINVSGKEITTNDTRYRINGYTSEIATLTITEQTVMTLKGTLDLTSAIQKTITINIATVTQYYVQLNNSNYYTVKKDNSSGESITTGYYDSGTVLYITNTGTTGNFLGIGATGKNYVYVENDYDKNDDTTYAAKTKSFQYELNKKATINATDDSTCIAKGTLLTLADGTKKKVEDLTMDDLLLVFNHETGTYSYAKLLVNEHSKDDTYKLYTVINMNFSNGSTVKVIKEHGFFDLTLNKYVYVNESNYTEFIGHKFYSASFDGTTYTSSIVTLDSVILKQEYTAIYSPVTENGYNLFTEDILSVTTDLDELLNVFEFDENMKYDEELMTADIEKYGLFTYEEVQYLMPYEVYVRIPVKYYKVAIGKGLVTIEDIESLADKYMSEIVDNMDATDST